MTAAQIPPPWFDDFWEQKSPALPFLMRSEGVKMIAWDLLSSLLGILQEQSTTPSGVKAIIGMAKVQAILRGTQWVMNAPDPSPEQVAEAVERLMQKVKP